MPALHRALLPFALLALTASCAKATEAPPPATPPTAAPAAPVAPPAPIAGPVGDVLATYEEMQARFSRDDVGAATLADKLAAAATAAATAATGATKQPLSDLAAAATRMGAQAKAAPPAGLDAQRAVFADVSKAVVGLLVADPTLQTGRFIFECPMAPAYKKWVQTTPKLQNPYWGSKMLECGDKTTWGV